MVDDILLPYDQEIFITNSVNENCVESEIQTERNYYVDLKRTYWALKMKIVKDRGYETYTSKEVKKEHKEEAKADGEKVAAEEEQKAPVSLITPVNNIFALNFYQC